MAGEVLWFFKQHNEQLVRMVFLTAKGFLRVMVTAILLSSCHGLNDGFKACLVGSGVAGFLNAIEMQAVS